MSTQIHSGLHAPGGKVHLYYASDNGKVYPSSCICGGGGNNVNAHLRRTVREIDVHPVTCATCARVAERAAANAPDSFTPQLRSAMGIK